MRNRYKHKKKTVRKSIYSNEYMKQQRDKMYELLGKANSEQEANNIIKAFDVSTNPARF